ncbi:hybrid sensor histidine kinase/response regulator [Kiloniella spongiae]|uniref:hybrid sensor histidine kinase/response regulator n=1 Tax=Kiloniella spongiae TaxID=1489064 RepID=UPI00138E536C|nr:hybrid sensor histidine kinase/response regulator [Kiloniella spongiae]
MTDLVSLEWQKLCATQLPIPVLYVDDDTSFVEEVKGVLTPLGYKLTPVLSAEEAFEFQSMSPAFLVIVNHTLPDSPGIDLIKKLLAVNPQLQTVFITSQETEYQATEALRAGVTCYINKDPKAVFFDVLPAILERTLLRAETTKRQQNLEREVRESQLRLSQAVTLAELGFWEWDETRNTALYYSPELLKIYEMDASQVELGSWTANKDLKHLHPDDYENYRYKSHFHDGTTDRFDVEFRINKSNGSIAYLREIGQAIRNDSGDIIRSYGTVQDITQIKITEQTLQLALSEAEKANRTKASFLASMSHELRTPLNAILGFSEILTEEHFGPLGSEKYMHYARDIHNSGNHLLSLISSILEVSSAEAGQLQLEKESLPLCQLIKDCFEETTAIFTNTDIETELSIPLETMVIDADARAIRQILFNLLTNAAKFTPRNGKVSIILDEIVIERAHQSNGRLSEHSGYEAAVQDHAHIAIADNGIGIDQTDLSRLQQPFTRINTDPHLSQEGMGLGLAIVKSLIEAHSGIMEIESYPGQGTTVHLYLPL